MQLWFIIPGLLLSVFLLTDTKNALVFLKRDLADIFSC